jgi:hypothetical protein
MKKKVINLLFIFMMMCAAPTFANSSNETKPSATNAESARAVVLIERLEQINEMDKSSLSRTDKRTLRKEVKGIEKELRTQSDGVYISVGGVIIILLLLIILL